jgi:hypothetical protein
MAVSQATDIRVVLHCEVLFLLLLFVVSLFLFGVLGCGIERAAVAASFFKNLMCTAVTIVGRSHRRGVGQVYGTENKKK